MTTIASRLASTFGLVLLVPSFAAVWAQTPPVVTMPASRSSTGFVETAGGQVAVDGHFLEWRGVRVHLSLTFDLVGVDVASGRTLWARNVSAFWQQMTVAEVETAPGKKAWVVELRPGPGARHGAGERSYHDLLTGTPIPRPPGVPSGKHLEGLPAWEGSVTARSDGLVTVVGAAAGLDERIRQPFFAGIASAPDFVGLDFEQHLLLAVFEGEVFNCRGLGADIYEDESRILVRLQRRTFQTAGPDGGGQRLRPYGLFALPRRTPFKPIIVERNRQHLIGGPALWAELARFDALPGSPPGTPRK